MRARAQQSSRGQTIAVKADRHKPARSAGRHGGQGQKPGGLARHLEGWQPALLTVFIVAMTLAVVVPRPVEPTDLPEPRMNPAALARARELDERLASAAEREGLDPDVAEVARALLSYERADAAGGGGGERRAAQDAELQAARGQVARAVTQALILGDEPLLRLRAYQTRLFLRAVRRWEATGEQTGDLRDRGGGFLRTLRRYGWLEQRSRAGRSRAAAAGEPRLWHARVLVDDAVLRVMFKKRWSEITGIVTSAFQLTLDEQRALYRFLLKHPVGAKAAGLAEGVRLSPQAEAAFNGEYRLKKIDELARVDPAYPRALARGVVLYQMGRYPLAVEAFRTHLDGSHGGSFALRAQNYLHAALGKARAEQF